MCASEKSTTVAFIQFARPRHKSSHWMQRSISQIRASPFTRRKCHQQETGSDRKYHTRRRAAPLFTQRCASVYRLGTPLDELCPNVDHHRRGQDDPTQHIISAQDLMISLNGQRDENFDRCIPFARARVDFALCGIFALIFIAIIIMELLLLWEGSFQNHTPACNPELRQYWWKVRFLYQIDWR